MNKLTVIIFGIVIILIIGFFIYPMLMISAVYPPIKEYEYPVSALKLQSIILKIDETDTNVSCNITDTTGLKDNLSYYMNVRMKNKNKNYDFKIKYEDVNKFWKKSKYSEVGLIDVFDSTNKVGGYKEDDKGVKQLIDIFDKNFINQIETGFAASN